MAWEKLKKALQQMPETGPDGFEGFSTKILELILGETFLIARSGNQPSGDAHNLKRNISLQAKRYSEANPNAKNLEGDFDANLREMPETDVYVLAITKNSTQLDDTLNAMRDKSGVDVVVWEYDGEHSDLAILCVEFWDQLRSFDCVKSLDAELQPWITASRQTEAHKNHLKALVSSLRYFTQTFTATREIAHLYLERRFDPVKGVDLISSFPIELNKAVQRITYQNEVLQWWEAAKKRVITLVGEEGMGKTWLAAQCASHVSQQGDALVLWLESLNWRDCQSFEQALFEAILRLQIGDGNKAKRLVRKIRNQWSSKTLIVFDGVNERGALMAAQRILDDIVFKELGKCRILFTTRPLASVSGFEQSMWKRWPELPVERFNDEEFKMALSKIVPPVGLDDVPEQLASLARIPRYFRTCIKLRDRLKSFNNISLSLVLWTDLLDKIAGLEPQLREILGWANEQDAIDVLVKLATSSPNNVNQGIAQDLLNSCFGGKYSEVRHYLKEIRILKDAGVLEAKLNPDHTILGKALFLRALSQGLQDKTISEISDRLKKELEPLAGEDGSTEALFVALQVSALQDTNNSPAVTKQRAALLHAWLFSHNSNPTEERLTFWVEHDISAYAELTETFFENLYNGDAQHFIVKPLAVQWKANGEQAKLLEPYLRRWLLFVWFNGCPASQYEYQGHHLPVATTPQQVRLTAIALSILSLRPNYSFFSDLALCHATDSLTWQEYKTPDGKDHKHQFKSVHNNIGILMRWGYTEQVMPVLEELAKMSSGDALLLKGLQWLAYILRMVEIPAILRLPADDFLKPFHFGSPAVDLIRQKQRLFIPRVEGKPFLNERDFSYLAVREDLPMLADEDAHILTEAVEKMCSAEVVTKGSGQTLKEREFEAWWPWYAKFKPREFASLAGQLQLNALTLEQPYSLFRLLQAILVVLDETDFTKWIQLTRVKFQDAPKTFREVDHVASLISEAALLSMPGDILHEWIVNAASHGSLRTSMFFNPISELIPYVMPKKTTELAAHKCLELVGQTFGPIEGPPTELDYWCYLTSLMAQPNKQMFEWSQQLLLKSKPPKGRNFNLLRLWLRSAPSGYIESAINNPATENLFDEQTMRAWADSGNLPFDPKLVTASYEQLIQRLPKGFAGTIFAESGRDAELKRWGDELFGVALNSVGKAPITRKTRGQTKLTLGRNNEIKWIGFEYDDTRPRAATSTVSSWGVNLGSLGNLLQNQKEWAELFEQEFEKWKLDEVALQNWKDSDLHFFGAWKALEAYRKLNPGEFKDKVHLLLKAALSDLNSQFHIGGFLHSIISTLLPDAPKDAWQYFRRLNSDSLGIHVTSEFDVPEFYIRLWNLDSCSLPEHKALRMHLFEECQNEFEIMTLTVAALVNSAHSELFDTLKQLLTNDLAKNRALAVSILAWIGNDESNNLLEQLKSNDTSEWVRRHAEWALEVGLQEKSARAHFRRALYETDPLLVSAALQVLKPALTPVTRWWYFQIRREEEKNGLVLASRLAAIMESFWHHWQSVHHSSVASAGRKLDEYCRGERLDVLKTPRIAPWWNL